MKGTLARLGIRVDHAGGVECLDPRTNDHDRRVGRYPRAPFSPIIA
jgi:hypothetical protein